MRRPLMSSAFLAAGLLTLASAAQALPVIPGSGGFGMDTPAGRGGTVYKVTNLNASGTGSLKACIDGATPRVCVFEVSGTIRLTSDLIIRNDFITIAGQTAPSPGISLRGAALMITASNVLVQHLRIRVGDDATGPAYENRDALKITGSATKTVRNVVIDHCSFSWAVDEILSVWGPHDNITLSNNIFAEALNDSMHPSQTGPGFVPHGYGVILGSSPGSSVTIVGNLFGHLVERNPLSRAAELVYVNNVVYNRGHMDLDLQSDGVTPTRSTAVRNVFIRGPSYARDTSPIYVRTSGTLGLGLNSRAYQAGNTMVDYVREMVTLTGGDTIPGLLLLDSYPVWNSGLNVQTNQTAITDRVLNTSGARPADRDPVDRRVIGHVRTRTGQIINCVASDGTTRCARNAGGWPTLAQNRRTLTLPANPNTVTASGYTNLEVWLHSLDDSVKGVTQAKSPAPPQSLTVL
jgi:pectate lyase